MSEFTAPSVEELQEKFPNHKIESFIAQGGMGAVYLATQISLDRPVAIKILPKEFGEDEDYRVSFETEAKAMAKLNHSNLVGVYDFGDLDGMLYIIMEYIPGRSLHDTAHGQQVDQVEAASLIAEMCHGLDHAHASGMLHRDIKPANVLIDDEARPKIVDFGLARPLGEEQSDGVVFGTPGYTAPEVLTNPFAVDQRSDIFSMGVMLYEMLTGQLPGDPIMPASSLSHSDARFDTILTKAIHPNPDLRYPTAGEMAEALENLIKQFNQAPGLMATGAMAGAAINMAPNPVVLNSSSGGSSGAVIGVVAVLIIGGVAFMSMRGGDESTEGIAAAGGDTELSHLESLAKEEEKRAEKENKARLRMEKVENQRKEKAEKLRLKAEEKARVAADKAAREVDDNKGILEYGPNSVMNGGEGGGGEDSIQDAIAKAMSGEASGGDAEAGEAKYDYAGFIAKERADITVRSANVLRDYKEAREDIIDRQEEEFMKILSNLRMKAARIERIESQLTVFFEEWRENGGFSGKLRVFPAELLEKIQGFEAEMLEAVAERDEDLVRYKNIYAEEIRKKGSQLYKDKMMVSVEALKAELDVLDEEGYFYAIVSSKDPQPDEFED